MECGALLLPLQLLRVCLGHYPAATTTLGPIMSGTPQASGVQYTIMPYANVGAKLTLSV